MKKKKPQFIYLREQQFSNLGQERLQSNVQSSWLQWCLLKSYYKQKASSGFKSNWIKRDR